MTKLETIDKTNIEYFLNRAVISDNGKEFFLANKDIIIDYNPIEQFVYSINQNIGHSLRIMFLCSQALFDFTQSLKSIFGKKGYFTDDYVMNEGFASVKEAEHIASGLKEDTRLIISIGGYEIIETAKLVSSAVKLPLALYIPTPECDTALSPYACVYHQKARDVFVTKTPCIVCVDMSAIACSSQSSLGGGIGVLASRLVALWDWNFAHIFNNENGDYELMQAAFSVLNSFSHNADGILRKDMKALLEMVQAQLKLSAITQLSKSPRMSGGGEESAFNVLEMFFIKENKSLRARGENLFLCAKIILRAYKAWLSSLKVNQFLCPPDNTLRLEKLTDYMGLSELTALKKIYMIDNFEQWEIMQYKWDEYRQDLRQKLEQYCMCFENLERVFKRIYSDAAFWITKYLTESDIMLMLGLAPDTSPKFTMLSFVKMTGALDRYLEGV